MKKLYSFDIYDTLISRIPYTPTGIFELVQKIIASEDSGIVISSHIIGNFVSYRMNAERLASQLSETGEKSIDDIYEAFCRFTGCSKVCSNHFKEIELNLEKKLIYPIEKNINYIKEILSDNEKVILISDMYLSEKYIREILCSVDDIFTNIDIYVSVECGCSKSDGLLYKYIKDRYLIKYEDWTHVGDNLVSDGLVPNMLGIKTELFVADDGLNERLNTKSTITKPNIESLIFKGILKKKSREINRNITGILCGFIMYDYVNWLLSISQEKGVECIFFIARDGYILKRIADAIIEKEKINIRTSYLYGSRVAWRTDDLSKKDSVKSYMDQETNQYTNYAFVDLLATGRSFAEMRAYCNIEGLYFCYSLIGNGKQNIPNWFVYSAKTNNNKTIEVLCRALHGQTIGYEYDAEDERWKPMLGKYSATKKTKEEYDNYLNEIISVVGEIEDLNIITSKVLDYRSLSEELLKIIFTKPIEDISSFVGDTVHDGNNSENIKYAPLYSLEETIKIKKAEINYIGGDQDYSEKRLTTKDKEIVEEDLKSWYSQIIAKADCKKEKIILYGAGNIGRKAFANITKNNIGIIAWADRQYNKLSNEGYPVVSLDEAKSREYDYLLMAVSTNVDKLKLFLIECGIPETKIRNYNPKEWNG